MKKNNIVEIMKENIKTIIKVVVSLVLIMVVLKLSNPKEIISSIENANFSLLFIAFLLVLFSTIIASYRWFIVMKTLKYRGEFKFYLKSYFLGIFFNQLLPSSIGGDAYRVINVSSLGYRKIDVLSGVIIDRMLGLVGIFILNIIFNNILYDLLPLPLYYGINVICGIGILGFIFFTFLHKINFISKFRFMNIFISWSKDLWKVLNSPKRAIYQLSLTLFIHFLTFLGVYFISKSIGLSIGLLIFMVIMPPVILFTMVPISIAGWGVREGAMLLFFDLLMVPKELSVSISIIFGLFYIIQGIIGIFFWVNEKNKKVILNEN